MELHGRRYLLERRAEAEGALNRLLGFICNAFIPHCRPSPGPAASRGRLLISFTRVTFEVLVGNRARQAPRGTQHHLPLRVIHEHRTLRPTFARVA
jgi:hypothetical protein